jgi:hypothetical protein
MYLEAKETARLYKLLSEKLGNDTTEAMFKYIDNKTERSVEATIKTLVTKDDLHKAVSLAKDDLHNAVSVLKDDIATIKSDLQKSISESKADNIKWMFIFWIGQMAAMMSIILLFIKK